MSHAVRLWLLRSNVWLSLAPSVVVVLIAVFSRSHWTADLDIALQWANGSTVLLSPFAGSVAAFLVWRNYPRDFQALTRATQRGARTVLHIAIATWLTMVLAWLVGVAAVVLGVWAGGGNLAAHDPWVLVAGPMAVLPAVMLGTLAATAVRSLAAAPVVGLLIYVIIVWTYPLQMPAFLAVSGGTGTWTELRPIPEVVGASVLLNAMAGIGLACAAWRLAAGRPRRPAPADAIGVLAIGGVATLLIIFAQRESLDTHYIKEPAYSCAGTEPEVCVSQRGQLDAETVSTQLRDAHRKLAAAGLDLPTRYEEDGNESHSGVILLTEPPVDGGLSTFDLAMSLARPAQCDAYFGQFPPEDAFTAQWVLGHWLDVVTGPDTGADQWVEAFGDHHEDDVALWARRAYAALATCDLDAAVLRDVPNVEAQDWW